MLNLGDLKSWFLSAFNSTFKDLLTINQTFETDLYEIKMPHFLLIYSNKYDWQWTKLYKLTQHFSSLLLNVSYISALSSLGGMNQSRSFLYWPVSLGKLVSYPVLLLWWEKLYLAEEVLLRADQCWFWRWNDSGNMKLFPVSILWGYSQIFGCSLLLKVLMWTPELS